MSRRRSSELKGLTRRVFVHRLTFLGGGVVLLGSACDEPKKKEPAAAPAPKDVAKSDGMTTSHLTFTNEEFAVLTALVDRVLPKDEDPGAVEANVPEYIDHALQQQQLRKMKDDFTGGVEAINRRCTKIYKVGFAQATPVQQDAVLTSFKESPPDSGEFKWYEILIALTMEGFLGDPSYGGNKDQAGWKLVGFDLVGHEAMPMPPGYKGSEHLDHLRCSKKGC
jgi:gluconate 2-dehydrogenase gamma chain